MPVQPKQTVSASSRSKSGCLTCRGRKVKCDEAKPGCLMCTRLRLRCEYASGEAVCLHDRRLGAGPIKKRQFTGWRPQRIEAKKALAPPTAAALAAAISPNVPSPGPSVSSISMPSSMSSLSSPSVTATPPYMASAASVNGSNGSNGSGSYSLPAFPTPASEYTDFRPEEAILPRTRGNNMAACIPIASGPDIASTAGLDFSTFVQDDLLAAMSMRTPSPFSFMPAMDDAPYMFLNDLSTPLSPLLPPSTMALGSPSCAASTPMIMETEAPDSAPWTDSSYKTTFTSAYDLVSTSTPSPLASLVLGTTTMVLTSFPSRVRLTDRDYEALLLFHHHVGFSIGSKSPVWSTHAILIKLAVSHSAILHFLLAASFGELDWRLSTDKNSIPGSATSGLASLPTPMGNNSTISTISTPGQLARRHYEAGQAALNELANAPHRAAEAGLYHVVVVACFWLEYLINRRHVPSHGRWASQNEFSRAMGGYMRKYRLRRNLMGREAPPSSSLFTRSLSSVSLPMRPPSAPPAKCSPVDDDDDDNNDDDNNDDDNNDDDDEDEASSGEEDKIDEIPKGNNTKNKTNKTNAVQTQAPEMDIATTATSTANDASITTNRPMPPAKYRSFLSRLLSWLYWYDCAASFFGKGGSLAMQFHQPPRSQLNFYETARTTLLDFWDDYTPEEIADDNQNWPALQLINETWVAVHRLNLVFQAEESRHGQRTRRRSSPPSLAPTHAETVADIARDTRVLRTRYTTVFRLSTFAATSGGHRSRLLAMADWAVCHYLALELHLLRAGASCADLYGEGDNTLPSKESSAAMMGNAFGGGYGTYTGNYSGHGSHGTYQPGAANSTTSSSPHPQAIAAQIVHLAERAIRTVGPVELDRFQWPLFWAGVETDNHVYRYFVLSNLINNDFRAALQAIVQEQTSGGGDSGSGGGNYAGRCDRGCCATGSRVSMRRLRTICCAVGMAA
ncbi:hypothetical protein SCUCBS95973_004030 [Sporothrix curviconia]|uniref:Zn(2)-C6 fungal-type domain-containing protein n=1 Tax=Sporothrix curviconia TaxID=1260050 RepID=A0ABP0BKT7_9PEZI